MVHPILLAEHSTDVLHADRTPMGIRDQHLAKERVEWLAYLSREGLGVAGPNLAQYVKDVGAVNARFTVNSS